MQRHLPIHRAMTTLYFVRHAKPDLSEHIDETRPLTEQGLQERELVTEYLLDKGVDTVFSSPYKRAVDTVKHFADAKGLPIHLVDDFRERKVDNVWVEDFTSFTRKQWDNFGFKLSGGESLQEVQDRNVRALNQLLSRHNGKVCVVGSHGTALCTIIHYYDHAYGYKDFEQIRKLMPWIVKFDFIDNDCLSIEAIDLFSHQHTLLHNW